MQMINWVVTTGLNKKDIDTLLTYLKHINTKITEVNVKDSLTPTYLPPVFDMPTIIYGSVNFVLRCENSQLFNNSIFGKGDTFSYRNIIRYIDANKLFNNPNESHLGNASYIFDKLDNVNNNEYMFFKCGDDNKTISGKVREVRDIKQICQIIQTNKHPEITPDMDLLIAPPYKPENEYRLFYIDGKIVTGSQYYPTYNKYIPQYIIDYTNNMRESIDNISNTCVIDICESNNNLFIMEIQGINSCGFYCSDIPLFVDAMNKLACKLYNT